VPGRQPHIPSSWPKSYSTSHWQRWVCTTLQVA